MPSWTLEEVGLDHLRSNRPRPSQSAFIHLQSKRPFDVPRVSLDQFCQDPTLCCIRGSSLIADLTFDTNMVIEETGIGFLTSFAHFRPWRCNFSVPHLVSFTFRVTNMKVDDVWRETFENVESLTKEVERTLKRYRKVERRFRPKCPVELWRRLD